MPRDLPVSGPLRHQGRPEDRRSSAAGLHRVCGNLVAPSELHPIFYRTRFGRVLDRPGYARFQRWQVSAELSLGGESVAVWLHAQHLSLVYQDEPLAQFRVAYKPDRRHHLQAKPEQLFETPHRSPQPPQWTWGEDDWLSVLRSPAYAPRTSRPPGAVQPPLFALEGVSA